MTRSATTREISERAAAVARTSMTRDKLRRSLNDSDAFALLTAEERVGYRTVREELQADLDMDLDPAYGPLLSAVKDRIGARRVYRIVFHPERVLADEVTYPLTRDEAASLLAELLHGLKSERGGPVDSPEAWTLDRMVKEGLLPQTPTIGGGSLPRHAFFARHVVAAAYRALFVSEKPEALKAQATVVRRAVSPQTAAYLRVLPHTDPRLITRAVQRT